MAYVSRSRERNHQHQPSASETEFNLGVLYNSIEQQINAFAEKAGPAYSVADAADRVGQLLRLKAKDVWEKRRASELLHEMREELPPAGEGAGNHAGVESRPPLHVRARSNEALNNGHRKDYGRPQDPERVERIRKMVLAGMSQGEIGQALGVTGSAIHHQIKRYNLNDGVAPAPPAHRGPAKGVPKNETKLDQIRKMLGSGMTRADVAQALGMTKDGVGYWIRAYKIEEPVTPETDTMGRRITKKRPYTRTKPHWTQLPKNRARVKRIAAKGRKAWMKQSKEAKA